VIFHAQEIATGSTTGSTSRWNKHRVCGLLLVLLLCNATLIEVPEQARATEPQVVMPTKPLQLLGQQTLFRSGTAATHTYRIPAIITAANGDLIAACDARQTSAADLVHQRTIAIVFRRSSDLGATWSPIEVMSKGQEGGCSDPSFLLDKVSGELFCFYNFMSPDKQSREYRFLVQKSSDHGQTWQDAVDITDQVREPSLQLEFTFVTSGRGIQTRSGRLMHNFVHVGHGATLFFSDDHGKSWQSGAKVSPADESKVVELPDGTLMVNSRHNPGGRHVHRSSDNGATWRSGVETSLPDPRCNASILQFTAKRDGYAKDRLLFCNAASNAGRKNLAVRISYDHGQTWSEGKVIDSGPAAYSELTALTDGSIGVLYEPGHAEIRFVRFTLEALTDGQDTLEAPKVPAAR